MSNESRLQLLLIIVGAAMVSPLLYLGDGGLLSEVTFYVLLCFSILALGYETNRQKLTRLRPSFVLATTSLLFVVTLPLGIFIDTEIYRHIWDGLIQGQGENPYDHIPMSEAWMGMRGHEIYDLLQDPRFYSSSSPVEMVLHRFITWAEPLLGLNGLIISYKVISMIIGLSVIWVAIKLLGGESEVNAPILLLAWNPVLILMIAGQGSLENLAILGILGIIYFWDHHQPEILPMIWGIVLHLTLIAWLFLPWLIRRVRWTYLLIAIGTWAVWWLPFFSIDVFMNYISGLLSHHIYPPTSVTPGFLIAELFGWIYSGSEQWIFSSLLIGGLIYMIYNSKKGYTLDSYDVVASIFLVCLVLWMIIPTFSAALLGSIIVLSVIDERFYTVVTILSLTMIFQIIALRLDEWSWIPLLGAILIIIAAGVLTFKTNAEEIRATV